jgi:hypothetical protein
LLVLTVTGLNAWLWGSAYAVAVMLLMARANRAELLSFISEAPFFLLLLPVSCTEPAIEGGTHTWHRKRLHGAKSPNSGNSLL